MSQRIPGLGPIVTNSTPLVGDLRLSSSDIVASTAPSWSSNSNPTTLGALTSTRADTTDGGQACTIVTAIAGAGLHGLRETAATTPSNGETVTFIGDFKAGTESVVAIYATGAALTSSLIVDLVAITATIGGANSVDYSLQNLGLGWVRVIFLYRIPVGSTAEIRFYMRTSSGFVAAGTETMLMRNFSVTANTASAAGQWTQATKATQPQVRRSIFVAQAVGGDFTESSTYLSADASAAILGGGKPLTFAWYGHATNYANVVPSGDCPIFRTATNGGTYYVEIGLTQSSGVKWYLQFVGPSGTTRTIVSQKISTAGATMAVVLSGTTAQWYINGSPVGSPTALLIDSLTLITASIGKLGGATWSTYVTEFAAFSRALTPREVQNVCVSIAAKSGDSLRPWDLWLAFGQSNLAGVGQAAATASELGITIPEVWLPACFYTETNPTPKTTVPFAPANRWAADPVTGGGGAGGGGIVVGAATRLAALGKKAVIVSMAANGCGLAPSSYSWDPDSANMYSRSIAFAITRLTEIGGGYNFKGAFVVNGESDALVLADSQAFASRLRNLWDRMRADLGVSGGRLVISRLSDAQTALTYRTTLTAQQDSCADLGVVVNNDGRTSVDGTHYTPGSKYNVGIALANAAYQ